MRMDFHIPSILEQDEVASSDVKSFDPDRRIEANRIDTSPASAFDADKRLSSDGDSIDANSEHPESESIESAIEEAIDDYAKELKAFSEEPDTLPDKPFDASDVRRLSPEEVCERRSEFMVKKSELRQKWEALNGREWPKYDKDVVNDRGIVVRKAGTYYDAHHIKPISLGGKNEAANITPLSVDKHQGKQGIHRKDGTCDKLVKLVEMRQ